MRRVFALVAISAFTLACLAAPAEASTKNESRNSGGSSCQKTNAEKSTSTKSRSDICNASTAPKCTFTSTPPTFSLQWQPYMENNQYVGQSMGPIYVMNNYFYYQWTNEFDYWLGQNGFTYSWYTDCVVSSVFKFYTNGTEVVDSAYLQTFEETLYIRNLYNDADFASLFFSISSARRIFTMKDGSTLTVYWAPPSN